MNPFEEAARKFPVGSVWIHQASGGRYRITSHHERADRYETTGELSLRIGYVQLDDGVKRKAGAPYSRAVEDFVLQFKSE